MKKKLTVSFLLVFLLVSFVVATLPFHVLPVQALSDLPTPTQYLFDLSKWGSVFRLLNYSSANAMVNTVANSSDGLEWNVTCNGPVIQAWMSYNGNRSFPIETDNLEFYYQPPLDQELNVSEYDFVNETHAIKDGIVVNERPENVVGSYAAYSTTKRDNEYQTGKICHIYRPLLVDAVGQTSWGWMNITGNTFTIGWNSSWVAGCVFPLTIDPTFGYETMGNTKWTLGSDDLGGYGFTSPSASGIVVTQISVACNASATTKLSKAVIVLNSTLAIVANSVSGAVTVSTTRQWWNYTFTTNPVLSGNTLYDLAIVSQLSGSLLWYDTGVANTAIWDPTNSYTAPETADTAEFYNFKAGIFATYVTTPQSTLPATQYNTTTAGATCNFSCQWQDNTGLSFALFETNNTGANVNQSLALSGTSLVWANFTVTLNSTVGIKVSYKWYCNNTDNIWNTTTVAYVTITASMLPYISTFTVSSGATVYGYQNVNVTVTLWDADGAYEPSFGLKNCTVSFNQTGIDLNWAASGNATSKVDANNYCNLISNWTTTVNSTAVNVTWSVTFYWNATEAVYGLDTSTLVFDQQGQNGTLTTGSFTFEEDLIVKATPTFAHAREDPSSSVLLSGQLYYQGTSTAPYNTTGIVTHCELNGTSKGSNSSISSDGTFQVTITSEASPLGTYTYNVYSLTDETSTTNQTATFILERILVYAKDDPIIQKSINTQAITPQALPAQSFLFIIPVSIILFAGVFARKKMRKPFTLSIAVLLLLASYSTLTILPQLPVAEAAVSPNYYIRGINATHGQPRNGETGEPWQYNTDMGAITASAPTGSETRACSVWVQYWYDVSDTLMYWGITRIGYHLYVKADNGYEVQFGYECNGTWSSNVDEAMSLTGGDGSYHWVDGFWNVTTIVPPKVNSSYTFTIKVGLIIDGHPWVTTGSTDPCYVNFTYAPKPEPTSIGTTTTSVLANCTFYTFWTSDAVAGLSKYMFGCDNTGAWINETVWVDPWTGTPTTGWSNISKILNYTVGVTIKWQFWVNDTLNHFNTIGQQSFDITGKNVSVLVDAYVVIWFMARYETDGAAYTNASGSALSINGTSAMYDGVNNYWWVNVTQSIAGYYTYTVSAVADSTYGLTALNDVVGGVTVEWTPVSQQYSVALSKTITDTFNFAAQSAIKPALSQTMLVSWAVGDKWTAKAALSQAIIGGWLLVAGWTTKVNLAESFSSVYSLVGKWTSAFSFSYSAGSSWNIADKLSAKSDLSQSVTTVWSSVGTWAAKAGLSQTLASVWSTAIKWTATASLIESPTAVWSIADKLASNAGLSQTATSVWSTVARWTAKASLSQSVSSVWSIITHNVFSSSLSQSIGSSWTVLDHWTAKAGLTETLASVWSSVAKWTAKASLSDSIASSWSVADKWMAKAALSDTITSLWSVADKWTAKTALAESVISAWSTVLKWTGHSALSETISPVWSATDKWTANTVFSQSFATSWTSLTHWAANVGFSDTVTSAWNMLTPWSAKIGLAQPINGAWNTAAHWTANAGFSQGVSTVWSVTAEITGHMGQYILDFSQSIATTWNVITHWVANTGFSQSVSGTWNLLARWSTSADLSQSVNSVWGVHVGWFVNVGLSREITTAWNVLTAWTANVGLTEPFAFVPTSTARWTARAGLSQPVFTTWNVLVGNFKVIGLSQSIGTAWSTVTHWIAHASLSEQAGLSWTSTLHWATRSQMSNTITAAFSNLEKLGTQTSLTSPIATAWSTVSHWATQAGLSRTITTSWFFVAELFHEGGYIVAFAQHIGLSWSSISSWTANIQMSHSIFTVWIATIEQAFITTFSFTANGLWNFAASQASTINMGVPINLVGSSSVMSAYNTFLSNVINLAGSWSFPVPVVPVVPSSVASGLIGLTVGSMAFMIACLAYVRTLKVKRRQIPSL